MAQRSEALYHDRIVGIESIFTVIDGKQINIPEKLSELRAKSRRNELFCPCGCGSNLILVAGDKNLREQHFREKHAEGNAQCTYSQEGRHSVWSKIVLKCWLEDKLRAVDIESRVPICDVDDSSRRHEFSFLSRSRKFAVNYCRKRENLSSEKLHILDSNSQGIRLVHIVDAANAGSEGQYPESLMKVQKRQGYCLLLEIEGYDYFKARLRAAFYEKDFCGLWKEVPFAEGALKDFSISADGGLWFGSRPLERLLAVAREKFSAENDELRKKREEEEKTRARIAEAEGNARAGVQQPETLPEKNDDKLLRAQAEYARRKQAEWAAQSSGRSGYDGGRCPRCGSRLLESGERNKRFFRCSNFPRCSYSTGVRY